MIIIMLGAPGTGKGTVASKLSKKLNIPQISTGDIFRKLIKEGTELGKISDSYISKGQLVPDDITIEIVRERIKEPDTKNGMIFDGFPRTIEQAKKLDEMLKEQNLQVKVAINLTTPEEEIIQRIVDRRVCSNQDCKAIYNVTLNPPKEQDICDKCGSKLVKREDDTVETVKKRLTTYFERTSPLIDFYKEKGILQTEEVSIAINRMGENVAEDIVKSLQGE